MGFGEGANRPCLSQVWPGGLVTHLMSGEGESRPLPARDVIRGAVAPSGNIVLVVAGPEIIALSSGMQILWRDRLPTGRVGEIVFRPDGGAVILSDQSGLMAIYDLAARAFELIEEPGFNPAFSPSGEQYAFDDGTAVFVSVPGGPPRRIAAGIEPAWRPDGQHLVVRTSAATIDLVPLDGNERSGFIADEDVVSVPRWSADGRWMFFMRRGARSWFASLSPSSATEPVQLMVRRVSDGVEASVGEIAKGNPGDFHWVSSAEFCTVPQ